MKTKMNLGCDPEFFAVTYDNLTYDPGFLGNGVSAVPPILLERVHGVVPLSRSDTKHPRYIEQPIGDGFLTRYVGDGAAVELNFNKPFTSPEQMYDAVQESKGILSTWLDQFGLGMYDKPVVDFDYAKFWSPEHQEDVDYMWSIIFGCDPDVDAFAVDWLCQVLNAENHPSRYGGGHFHFSGPSSIAEHPIPFVKLLALTAGNYCMANAIDPSLEAKRAYYYGKPGKYRIQHYPNGMTGVEYRTPSNQWTSWRKDVFLGLFEWVDCAIQLLENPAQGKAALDEYAELTVQAITTANPEISRSVLQKLG